LAKSNHLVHNNTHSYSLYFLRGNDERLLSNSQAKEIEHIIANNNLQTSCLLYNPTEALRKFDSWNRSLPWIKAHYAIKSNPALPLLNDLQAKNAGFDCASRVEIQNVLDVGANKKDIIYSNPIKDESDLQWAERNGVQLTTADSIDELHKIKKYAPTMGVLWRIANKEEAADKLASPFSGKFGDDIDTEDKIHERMSEIQKLGVNIKGIHFHCGSGMHGSSAFGKAVFLARQCLKIGREYGHEMSIMDVGGGFPSGDLNKKTIDALKVTENDPLGYKVVAEPGRHFCGNSFYLLTRVLGRRLKNNQPCYHLNESLYHSFNCNVMDGVSFEGSNNQFYKALENGKSIEVGSAEKSTLFGMTCDGMDVITKNMEVPSKLKVGDWLCLSGMGAYTYGCRSNFNGMKSTERVIRWSTQVQRPVEAEPAFELAF
jgi:diaminopimelate decarboxylase